MDLAGKKTVLVIEDHAPVSNTIKDVLEIEGYEVEIANNGKEAVEILAHGQRPNLILLDLMMPVMNGWQFLDFQRENEEFKSIPVVVCSAYKETAKSVHPSAVIEKPLNLDSLLDTVKAHCA